MNHIRLLLLTGAFLASVGCYTTEPMRQRAQDLSARVVAYRHDQQQRIDRLNQSYREAFSRRMDELVQLTDQGLRADRGLDAQHLTDALITDYDALTLPGHLRDTMLKLIDEQRTRIRQADDGVAAARAEYQSAYKDAALELDRLDHIKANLDQLAVREDRNQTAEQLILKVAAIYRQLKDEADQQAGKKPTGGAVPQPAAAGSVGSTGGSGTGGGSTSK